MAASDYYTKTRRISATLFLLLATVLVAAIAMVPAATASTGKVEVELLKDIHTGSNAPSCTAGSFPHGMVKVNREVFFLASDGSSYQNLPQLWKTDGTGPGTVMVKNAITPEEYDTRDFGYEIWDAGIINMTNVNGTLFFSADEGLHGLELWKSDGTEAGTVMVKDINPGYGFSQNNSGLTPLVELNGTLFLSANDGAHGFELWKSDGTEAGTTLVKDINPGDGHGGVFNFVNINGTLYFVANDGVHGYELWKTDGTEAGTVMVKDANPGPGHSFPQELTDVNGTLFFAASGEKKAALWKSDGTGEGTVLVKDDVFAEELTDVNGTLFFKAFSSIHGQELLWKSDGTSADTMVVKDPGSGSSGSSPRFLTNANGTLYFQAYDEAHGFELWKSDGTERDTVMVEDINAGSLGSGPRALVAVGDFVFFNAFDGRHGEELWMSDGTKGGTTMTRDIFKGPASSDPGPGVELKGKLLFSAQDCFGDRFVLNNELWQAEVKR